MACNLTVMTSRATTAPRETKAVRKTNSRASRRFREVWRGKILGIGITITAVSISRSDTQKPRMILLPMLQCAARTDAGADQTLRSGPHWSGGRMMKAAIQRLITIMLVYIAALRAVIRPNTQKMRQ